MEKWAAVNEKGQALNSENRQWLSTGLGEEE
jgi:hypothetical protein